ncbi:MAG TPA: restriction endonuclease [Hydrogenothermaceae bacterium]|nr:restriction endonuclease [Hydrogenothermaceae bacterium]
MNYQRTVQELESKATLWWSAQLHEASANISIIPKLLETQDDFLRIISLSKGNPFKVFDLLEASEFPANLFLKHLSVLADYGGEPIQRLGRSFDDIFKNNNGKYLINFIWEARSFEYEFNTLPVRGLGNKKLFIDGEGLNRVQSLNDIYKDMIIILMFGSTSTVSEEAGLSKCEIGTLLGKAEILERFVKQRYINVSRITGGATANSLGQLAQKEVVNYLKNSLPKEYKVISNGYIQLNGYNKEGRIPFDIVIERENQFIGIEISFQVTTNSTIERKAGQASDRFRLMHSNSYKIAYVLDGAGNFQRQSALSTICKYSDCSVAYSAEEFEVLSNWIKETI